MSALTPPVGRVPRPLLIAALASGAAALIFETLWARSLAIMLGSTVQANALVFAAFLIGLASGAYLFGRVADRFRRLVRSYAITELAIGVTGLAAGWFLHQRGSGLASWVGQSEGSTKLLLILLLTLLVVGVPTGLMGATFPLLLAAARQLRGGLSELYGLYAINTLGAACGTLAAGLFTIPELGVSGSLLVAAALNGTAAVLAWPLDSAPRVTEDDDAPTDATEGEVDDDRRLVALLLVAAFGSGLVILAMEVAWSRLASYFLGNRTLAFTVLLAWVLVLLSCGSWLARRLAPRAGRDAPLIFGGLLTAAAGALAMTTLAAWWWIGHQQAIEQVLPQGPWLRLGYRIVETGLLMAPSMLVLGCIFPLSLLCSPGIAQRTGKQAGRFYLINTMGSVLGSLLTGFWGIPTFGTFTWIAVLITLCALGALAFFTVGLRRAGTDEGPRRRYATGVIVTVVILVGAAFLLPDALTVQRPNEELLYRKEDEYGVLQVLKRPDGTLRVINNRTELVYHLGHIETSYVQQMQGHLGMFFCPEAESAVVLGSGYGITAGALGLYAQLEHIDAVEIVPGMIEAAALFAPYNLGYHHNPRIALIVDDGRHFLAAREKRYDIVSVNVSDPHLPGASSLFHREFYTLAKQRMTDGGVLLQHAFGADVDTVLATLHDSFAHLVTTKAYGNGYNIVASNRPLVFDEVKVRALIADRKVRQALEGIGFVPPVDVATVLAHQADIEPPSAGAPIATDDRPHLEFSWSGDPSLWLFSNE